jgi:AraC-like DNA-binding protein
MSMFTAQETPEGRADGLAHEIAELREMSIPQLNEHYDQVFGVKPLVAYRQYLVRRIAWKLQAISWGGLSETAMLRASEIARDIRFDDSASVIVETRASSSRKRNRLRPDKRQPEAGSELTRIYKDRRIVVKVHSSGYEYDGKQYSSLSAVARAAAGTPWNGLVFFGLAKRGATKKEPTKKARKSGKVARHAA